MHRLMALFAGYVLCTQALADTPGVPDKVPVTSQLTQASGGNLGSQLAQLSLGLLLVIGLIFLLAWLARRLQQRLPTGNRNDCIQLLASRPLGPRERLLLVQVGKEQVLLGLTPGSIEPLHVLQEPVSIELESPKTAGEFAKRLKQVLRQSDSTDKES